MKASLSTLLASVLLLISAASAKDKKKQTFPADVLRAQTALVVIYPEAGEPLDEPGANAIARNNVEKALMEWGRFHLVMDGADPDLIISIRTGSGRLVRPTMRGGPIDQRPGVGQSTDSSIRIGAQRGQVPPLTDPSMDPRSQGPRVQNEVGPSEDMFEVYRGHIGNPLDASPVWRYIKKDCLRPAPLVPAVEEFRKALAAAEQPSVPKKP